VIVDRVSTPRGELVLRQDGEHFEVISNGTFLMDTRNGESERLLVRAALDAAIRPRRVLIGGLGVGFSLGEALTDTRVTSVDVVEIESTIVSWHRAHLVSYTAEALADPRVSVVVTGIVDHLRSSTDRYDVICLDVDNGPDWTVTNDNAEIYGDAGTALVASRLAHGGVLSVWSASRSPAYQTTLHRHFAHVAAHEVTVQRGEPDVVMVASGPDSGARVARPG
jgi:spermidine synthase